MYPEAVIGGHLRGQRLPVSRLAGRHGNVNCRQSRPWHAQFATSHVSVHGAVAHYLGVSPTPSIVTTKLTSGSVRRSRSTKRRKRHFSCVDADRMGEPPRRLLRVRKRGTRGGHCSIPRSPSRRGAAAATSIATPAQSSIGSSSSRRAPPHHHRRTTTAPPLRSTIALLGKLPGQGGRSDHGAARTCLAVPQSSNERNF